MNQDTLTRLDWVIEAVKKAPSLKFNMDYWEHRHWWCGTTHCAIGWACQDKRVQATGLILFGNRDDMGPRFEGTGGYEAIARWLDIPESHIGHLFGPGQDAGKSKQEVLKRLLSYRAQVGYELARRCPRGQQQVLETAQEKVQKIIAGAMEAVNAPNQGVADAHTHHD